MPEFNHNLAIAIGINNYRNGIAELKTARPDAEKLAGLLSKDYKYQVELITDKTDRKPTFAELTHLLLEELPQKLRSGEKSRLLFYFAGHGMPLESDDGPRGFLLPQDADPSDSSTFLSMQVLHDALIALPCHHLLIILDCCFAGTFRWASTRKLIPLPETLYREHYDRFIDYPAWQIITSAAHNQEALDFLTDKRGISSKFQQEATPHSPFAQALFDALQDSDIGEKGIRYKKADLTKDGVITASELYLYLRDSVETRSKERQTPGIYPLKKHDRGEYIFHDPNFDPNSLTQADPVNKANNPYRGLNPFEEKHARFFFGRQELIEQLCDRITTPDHPLTVVLGVSGSGKSSLVKAGLIPYLRQQQQEPRQQWKILAPMRPGESPFTALARTLFSIAPSSDPIPLTALDFLSQNLQLEVKRLNDVVRNLSEQSPQNSSAIAQSKQDAQHLTQLLHTWNQGTLTEKQQLIVEHFEPLYTLCQTSPNQELEQQQLKQVFQESLNLLSEQLQTNSNSFIEIVHQWSQQNPNINLLLIIDQFEELITFSRTQQMGNSDDRPDESQQFLHLLERSLTANLPYLRIVVTLRSDFEPRFLNSEILKSYWTKARFPVRAMRSDELRQAIEGPASEMALYFEPTNLVDRLIDEVGQMPGALPLLSFTLSELYLKLAEKWRRLETGDRALTIDTEFEKEGGVAGSLTRRANEEYRKLSEDPNLSKTAQQTMRRVMLRMLTLEGGEITRRRVPDSELIYPTQEESDRVKQVVDRLVNARLLVRGQLETGEPYVEPAHDFLVRGWGTLQDWIDEEKAKETLELQQRLTAQANDWNRNNRPDGLLLPDGDRLKRLEELHRSAPNWFNQRETELIQSSIKQATKNRARLELPQKAERVQRLVTIQPLECLVLAIQTFGQNLDELAEEILSSVQASLHKAIELAREQNVLIPHQSKKKSLSAVLSSDGQRIVAFRDTHILQWSIEGDLISEFCVHKNPQQDSSTITAVALNLSNDLIVSGDTAGTIKVWQASGQQIRSLKKHKTQISALAFDSVNQVIISGDIHGYIGLWSLDGDPICELLQAHLKSEPLLATDDSFGNVTVAQKINSIAVSSDGRYFISGGDDCTVHFWTTKGELIHVFGKHEYSVEHVTFSINNKKILSCDENGGVQIWNQAGNLLQSLFSKIDSPGKISIDLQREIIIRHTPQNRKVQLFDFEGRLIRQFSNPTQFVEWLALFQIPNNEFACLTGEHGLLRICDLKGHQQGQPFRNHVGRVGSVASDPSCRYIVSAGQTNRANSPIQEEKAVCFWNTTGTPIKVLEHKSDVSAIAFSRGGEYFASFDGSIWLWNCQGDLIREFPELIENIVVRDAAISFSPDAELIIVCAYYDTSKNKDEVIVAKWNYQGNLISKAQRGYETKEYEGKKIWTLAISPDSQQILIGGNPLEMIDQQTNQTVEFKGGHRNSDSSIIAATFSPDGLHVATGSFDRSIQLWNSQGRPIGNSFTGHEAAVSAIAFSPDGVHIASGDGNGVIRLWDFKGNSIGEFYGHEKAVSTLSFSPDGQTLISGGNDGTVRLWRANWRSWLKIACDRLRYHPVFKNPDSIGNQEQREIAIAACKTCKKYVWNAEDKID